MTANHDAVSGLVDQAFNLHIQLEDLKKQVFHVSDDLHNLYNAYIGLQVITADCGADAENVCAVIFGLNYRFEHLLACLDVLYQKTPATPES